MNKIVFLVFFIFSTSIYCNKDININSFNEISVFESSDNRFSKKFDNLFQPLEVESGDYLDPDLAKIVVILSIVTTIVVTSGTYVIVKNSY
ncbi:hypothetical protein JXR93_01220 [bacterium]|nr:hypothetical protein [bacterium]